MVPTVVHKPNIGWCHWTFRRGLALTVKAYNSKSNFTGVYRSDFHSRFGFLARVPSFVARRARPANKCGRGDRSDGQYSAKSKLALSPKRACHRQSAIATGVTCQSYGGRWRECPGRVTRLNLLQDRIVPNQRSKSTWPNFRSAPPARTLRPLCPEGPGQVLPGYPAYHTSGGDGNELLIGAPSYRGSNDTIGT